MGPLESARAQKKKKDEKTFAVAMAQFIISILTLEKKMMQQSVFQASAVP